MRIYVASRFSDYERVRALCDEIRATGYTVTHDWTRTREFGPDGHPLSASPDDLPPLEARGHAQADLEGVRSADLVVFLADLGDYCGALIEVATAIAAGRQVFVVKPWRPSIFWHLPRVTVYPHLDAVRHSLGLRAAA